MAMLNPRRFREAAEGIAFVGGPQALFELLDGVNGPDPTTPSGLWISPWLSDTCTGVKD
jgi:hypothetical protein